MLTISVEFLHGVFRADPTGSANTGQSNRGEWPPAPSRLFAALVAADGTADRCRVTDGTELEWMERLPAPIIHANPDVRHRQLLPRYVAESKRSGGAATHQEYVGRSGALVRPGVRVAPRQSKVTYRWPIESPPDESRLRSLKLRGARVGYLGTADSPVRLRVASAMPKDAVETVFTPDKLGNLPINVPHPGDLKLLDAMFKQWQKKGPAVTRAWFPALQHEVMYRPPEPVPEGDDRGEVVAWLRIGTPQPQSNRFGTPISGRRIATVTALFKAAVLSKHQVLFGEPPNVLHGHGLQGNGYELARFLALPDVGSRWSRGSIHGLALWLPPVTDSDTRRRAADAASAVRELRGSGVNAEVAVHDGAPRPYAARPRRWRAKSKRWATAFPAIHERRKPVDLDEVSRWCRHAGLPAPVRIRASRTPLVRGAVDLTPVEVNRPGRVPMPYSHVEMIFDKLLAGPIVVGSGRQRGFGLCVPVPDEGE